MNNTSKRTSILKLVFILSVLIVRASPGQENKPQQITADSKSKLFLLDDATTLAQLSQQQITADSKPKLFQGKLGSVTTVGSEEIATIHGSGDVTIIAREIIAGDTGKKEWGIEVFVHQIHSWLTDREGWSSALVSYEEIESLIKAIDYLSSVDNRVTKLKHFRVVYSNSSGLTIRKGNNFEGKSENEETRFQVSADGMVFFGDLNAFKDAVVRAKEKLESLQRDEIKK